MNSVSVVIAPDSFKGCLGAAAVARAIATGVRNICPSACISHLPLADGGEGTLDCLATALPEAVWQSAVVKAVHGQDVHARWLQLDRYSAVIESAEVLGLPLVAPAGPDIHQRGSHALGRLVSAVLDTGCRHIYLALGGSATNDCGLGLLQALGLDFTDTHGAPVPPTLEGLLAVRHINGDNVDPRLSGTEIVVLCDVDNPLTGRSGATYTYGSQKQLAAKDLDTVDRAMSAFADLCSVYRHTDPGMPGCGAAGGLGFALALLGAELASGAERLLELCNFENRLQGCQLVITGEGRADSQTLYGKLPATVAAVARRHAVPVALVAGVVVEDARERLETRFASVDSLTRLAGSSDAAFNQVSHWLEAAGELIARDLLPIT